MSNASSFFILSALSLLAGCASFVPSVPCTYRFKMLSRGEDQDRVETSIRKIAVGAVSKTGTDAYPEYRFRVRKMADLDTLNAQLMYARPRSWLETNRNQTLNLRTAGIELVFDSTDVTAKTVTTLTFQIKPGSRLYYKDGNGIERDITDRINNRGTVVLPVTMKEGQKYIFARAVRSNVTRYIRINIFTNEVKDVRSGEY